MKPSIQKLRKFFRLEADRGYDNKAVMGGLANILSAWELEAREDQLPEQLIQAVITRLRDYHRLSEESREVTLKGIWQRVTKDTLGAEPEISPQEKTPSQPVPRPLEDPEPSSPKEEVGTQPSKDKPIRATPPAPPGEVLDLETSIKSLKGIGDKKASALARIRIKNVKDLLYNFPRRHDDYSKLKPIGSLWFGEDVTIIGTVENVSTRSVRSGRMKIVEALISDKSGAIRATWFNQPWIEGQLSKANQVVLSGEIDQYLGKLVLNNPEWEPLSKKQLHTNRIVPVYPLTKDITQKWLRGITHSVVEKYSSGLEDPLPDSLLDKNSLLDLPTAIREIHFPDSEKSLHKAKQRLAFDEIFLMQMGVLEQKKEWESRPGKVFESDDPWIKSRLRNLPFKLTSAQEKALDQVRKDLRSGNPMNRLLQGDVGSGKTVIAALAALIVCRAKAQAAFLAPTSILAEQHFQSLQELLTPQPGGLETSQIRLLVGSTPEKEKEEIRKSLRDGMIKLVVGTHALLQEPIECQNLQLAIIEEQNRF